MKGAEEITNLLEIEEKASSPPKKLCEVYIAYLNENMTFYQMMGHFMLGGELSSEATKKLNQTMRSLMDRIEGIVQSTGIQKDTRAVSHSLFSALQGIMISYARYPGRNNEEIKKHTVKLAGLIADVFTKKLK